MTSLASIASGSRLGRTVERFNLWALHLTRPGPRWLLRSVALGLLMKATYIPVGLAVWGVQSAFGYEPPPSVKPDLFKIVFLGLILAPLFETAQIWLVHALTRRWLGLTGFVLASALLAYAGHAANNSPVSAAVAFLLMSYQYVSFRSELGPGKAFAGVAVSHAACNAVPALIVAFEHVTGRELL